MWGYNPKANPNPGKGNENVILVYHKINNATGRDIPPDEVWLIKKGDNKTSHLRSRDADSR
jgi:hypothetical protein